MSSTDERILLATLTDNPKFDAEHVEQAGKEREWEKKRHTIKFLIFSLLLLFYVYIFFVGGYWEYFFDYTDIHKGSYENPLWFLFVFILGAVFIWLPERTLKDIGRIKFLSQWWSGVEANPSPAAALRFFGWLIFLTPTAILLLS